MNGLTNGNQSEESLHCGMYSVKRPYEIPDVKLAASSICMYQIEPIKAVIDSVSISNHDLATGSTSRGTLTSTENKAVKSTSSTTMTTTSNSDVVDSLEQRQLKIIERLTSLRDMITTIHSKCVVAGSLSTTSLTDDTQKAQTDLQTLSEDNIDIVIHANPNNPPYILLFFANLIENNYSNAVISIDSHVHSSFKGKIDQNRVAAFKKEVQKANVRFTIVWKDALESTMIVTPVQSTSIQKEANIARFLSRLLPASSSSLNYDCLTWDTLVKVDGLLDQADDPKVISIIERELKKSKEGFLAGEPTIADLVLYSVLACKGAKELKDIPASVKAWLKRIESAFGVRILKLS